MVRARSGHSIRRDTYSDGGKTVCDAATATVNVDSFDGFDSLWLASRFGSPQLFRASSRFCTPLVGIEPVCVLQVAWRWRCPDCIDRGVRKSLKLPSGRRR